MNLPYGVVCCSNGIIIVQNLSQIYKKRTLSDAFTCVYFFL